MRSARLFAYMMMAWLLALVMIFGVFVAAISVRASPMEQPPPTAVSADVPIPELDFENYQPKYVDISLDFTVSGVSLNWGWISTGYAPARPDAPHELEVSLWNYQGELFELFYMWDPLRLDKYTPGMFPPWVSSEKTIPHASVDIMFPFNTNLKTMQIADGETRTNLIEVDLEEILRNYCLETPDDGDCLPDLVPTFTGPEGNQVHLNQVLVIPVTVENLGGDTVPAGVKLTLSVFDVSTPYAPVYWYSSEIGVALAPGETVTEDMPLTIPTGVMPGDYILQVQVDPDITFWELDKDNNIFWRFIHVTEALAVP